MKPTHRQAVFNETPLRPIGENDFATLTIRADGTGVARRKALFGSQDVPLEWSIQEGGIYYIDVVGLMRMVAYVDGNKLNAGIRADVPGMDNTGIYFVRSR